MSTAVAENTTSVQNLPLADIIVTYTVIVAIFIGIVLEWMCLILFVHNFFKKTTAFCSKYFYTIAFGYIVAIISFTLPLLQYFFPQISIFNIASIITGWYFNIFLGPWNTVLAINRCTALLFWQKHSKIWSNGNFDFCIGAIFLYPAIIIGILFFQDQHCFETMNKFECSKTTDRYDKAQIISNGITICSSALLGITVVALLRFKIVKISRDTKNIETHLFFQSIISLSFFMVYCIFRVIQNLLNNVENENETVVAYILKLILFVFTNCYCLYFHLSSTILFFCLSETVRQSFAKLYFCSSISERKKNSTTRISTNNNSQFQIKQTQLF